MPDIYHPTKTIALPIEVLRSGVVTTGTLKIFVNGTLALLHDDESTPGTTFFDGDENGLSTTQRVSFDAV